MYKAYCTDLDGTLFNAHSVLTPENKTAIDEIAGMGIHFVPTSGRTVQEMPKCLVDNPSVRYIIYSNGAGVIDKKTGEKSEELIDKKTVTAILDIMRDYPSLLAIHRSCECFIDGEGVKKFEDYKIEKAYIKLYELINVVEENFDAFVRASEPIEMFVIFFGKNVNEEECIGRLSKIEGIYITSSADGNVEIISAKANKGNGVRRFAKMAGIKCDEIICTGDGRNDIALLDAAGLSLAVSNAKPELKEAADEVICSCNEHVAKFVLENYLKK